MSTMAPEAPPQGSVMLLRHISWQSYRSLRDDLGDDSVHLTYDNGLLEIEVPSIRHEQLKKAVGRLVEMLLEAAERDYEPLGSTTWSREALLKGIEADECYYVEHAAAIRGRESLTIGEDPPPDLAIEVEVHRSSLNKLSIYAALGIPEVWRVREDGSVTFLRYQTTGEYTPVTQSEVVPNVNAEALQAALSKLNPPGPLSYPQMLREFAAMLAGRGRGG